MKHAGFLIDACCGLLVSALICSAWAQKPGGQAPGKSPAPSSPTAQNPTQAAVLARIQQLQNERALNTTALLDNSLTDQQRRGLETRASQLDNEIRNLRNQLHLPAENH